jgi:hypothetical protein
MVPFSAYQSVLSLLDSSSQKSGFGGYERSWAGASGRLRRWASALCLGGGDRLGDVVSWTGAGLVNQGVVGWFPVAGCSGVVLGISCILLLRPGEGFGVGSHLGFEGYGAAGSGGR